jgi:nucleotide sugar dehydrogenase
MNVTVVGAGKMGLPLACQLAHGGAQVTACDIRQDVVAAINAGASPIDEPGIAPMLERLVHAGRLRASADTRAATAASDVIIVIVPVLLTPERDADTSTIEAVSRQVAAGLHAGAMVVYETTLPVGTTRRFAAILESSGLKAGMDFDLAFSPERVKSQLVLDHLTKNPKVVGGLTPQAAERAAAFYRQYLGAPVMNVGTLEAAEFVKLAGMVYRDVNIALANELARYAELAGIDYYSILGAANTDGEAALLLPGIGVGGHCTPVYPFFLIRDSERRGQPAELCALGRRINDDQAAYSLDRLERLWRPLRGSQALILGLGFRPQVKEHIYSPAFLLRGELEKRGARVSLHDPLYTHDEIRAHGFTPASLDNEAAATLPEIFVLNTAHDVYRTLDFPALARRGVQAVIDGRAFWDPASVRAAGLFYLAVGRPSPSAAEVSVA